MAQRQAPHCLTRLCAVAPAWPHPAALTHTRHPPPRPQASDTNNNDPAREVEALEAVRDSTFITQLWSCVVGLYDYTLLLEYCPYGTLEGLLKVQRGMVGVGGGTCWQAGARGARRGAVVGLLQRVMPALEGPV